MRIILRGRCSIWWCLRLTHVTPRIVNNVSSMIRINHESDFAWQVQHLVKFKCHFSWQVQHLVKFGRIAGARNVVFFIVAPRIVNDVSYETRISIWWCWRVTFRGRRSIRWSSSVTFRESRFAWQVQHLMMWQAQYSVKFKCHFSWKSFCVTGAAFDDVGVSFFVTGAAFGANWNACRSAKCCFFSIQKMLVAGSVCGEVGGWHFVLRAS